MQIDLLAVDDDLVVAHKPVGLPTHASQPDAAPTDLVRLLEAQLGLTGLGVHQRLDRDTSGVLAFARSARANAALAEAFAQGTIHKTYLALVAGVPPAEGVIEAPLAPTHSGQMGVAPPGDRRAQSARTAFWRLEHTPDGRFALLELHPTTGRTHQLRVHLAHIGHPVVGDPLYAPQHPAPRMLLHAHRLRLPHPADGLEREWIAPPPPLFARLATGLPELMACDASALPGLLELAAARRQPLTDDPATTFYRLWHGPGEAPWHPLLGQLTVDRLDDVLVCSVYVEAQRTIPSAVLEALRDAWPATTAIYAKYRPRSAAHVAPEELAALAPPLPVWGTPRPAVAVLEAGCRFELRPADDLSIGLYADMRETRQRVAALQANRPGRVLNTFAYTCGFGAAADRSGGHTVNLDLSRSSLNWGMHNYQLNALPADPHDFVFGDVFDWLVRWARQGRRFDMVILDPPSFARAKGRAWRIEHDYAALIELAARLLEPDGWLVACCNHAGMSRRAVRGLVEQGMAAAGWPGTLHATYAASALDFPAGSAESHLKIVVAAGGSNANPG